MLVSVHVLAAPSFLIVFLVFTYLWWKLSETRSLLRIATNELLTLKLNTQNKAPLPDVYAVKDLANLQASELKFRTQLLILNITLHRISTCEEQLRGINQSQIIQGVFYNEVVPVLKKFNERFDVVLQQYKTGGVVGKLN